SPVEKDLEFDLAAFGMIGLETALPLVLRLVKEEVIPLTRAVELLTAGPARCFGLAGGHLGIGAPADVTVIDPDRSWTVGRSALQTKSLNSPFLGWELAGRAALTVVAGRVVHDLEGLAS